MDRMLRPPRDIRCGDAAGDVVALDGAPVASLDDPLYARSRRVWSAGDYERIAAGFRHEAEAFVARLGLGPQHAVLDAACGTGNLALPAARAGATVIALDIAGALLDVGRDRARREGLRGEWEEGTVEAMHYPDATFDAALSMFGVSFAARPEHAAEELARVVRPGGRLALACWTAEGFVGRMLALHAEALPPPPGQPSSLAWGDDAAVRALLGEHRWRIATVKRRLTFRYPHSPRGTAELFRAAYGPTVTVMQALDEDGRAQLHAELSDHWARNALDAAGFTEVESEYLEVMATRR